MRKSATVGRGRDMDELQRSFDELKRDILAIFPPEEYEGRYFLIQTFAEIGDDARYESKGPLFRLWLSVN
jgi:hypothetical protein